MHGPCSCCVSTRSCRGNRSDDVQAHRSEIIFSSAGLSGVAVPGGLGDDVEVFIFKSALGANSSRVTAGTMLIPVDR